MWLLTSLRSRAATCHWKPVWLWPPTSCRLGMTCAVLLTSLLLLVTASTMPFSLVYSAVHNKAALESYVAELNDRRTDEALQYLKTLPRKTEEELRSMSKLTADTSPRPGAGRKSGSGDAGSGDVLFAFTIAIVTVSRKIPENSNRSVGYVLQSATALDALVKRSGLFAGKTFVFVCNVDAYPANHQDAAALRDVFPFAERYGGSSVPGVADLALPGTDTLYRSMKHAYGHGLGGSLDRERHDYTFCLQVARRIPSRYYLLFQDDALPLPDFAGVLALTLAKLNKCEGGEEELSQREEGESRFPPPSFKPSSVSSSSPPPPLRPSAKCLSEHPPYTQDLVSQKRKRRISPSPDANFGSVKFYFPDRWNGFSFDFLRIVELASLLAVGAGLALLLHGVVCCARGLSYVPTWKVFLIGVLLSLVGCELFGRQNINELRRVSKYFYRLQPSPDCCIPAMLYPATVMPFLITWLAESPAQSKVDLRVAECFKHYEVVTYYIEPNIVRHVGMVTSIKKINEKPVEEFLLF